MGVVPELCACLVSFACLHGLSETFPDVTVTAPPLQMKDGKSFVHVRIHVTHACSGRVFESSRVLLLLLLLLLYRQRVEAVPARVLLVCFPLCECMARSTERFRPSDVSSAGHWQQ